MINKIIHYIKAKQAERKQKKIFKEKLERLKEARRYIREFDDVPLTWHLEGVCKILRVKENEKSKDFLFELAWPGTRLEDLVKRLP